MQADTRARGTHRLAVSLPALLIVVLRRGLWQSCRDWPSGLDGSVGRLMDPILHDEVCVGDTQSLLAERHCGALRISAHA